MSVQLQTNYLGIKLANPLVVSACPLTEKIDNLKRIEQAGASAAVFPSLFEEQIAEQQMDLHMMYEGRAHTFPEALSYFPDMRDYNVGPEGYLKRLAEAKKAVSIPIIGSLNGITTGGWTRHASHIQQAGADALELNIHIVASDPQRTSEEVEQAYIELVQEVRGAVTIPLAVKITPYFSALGNFARRLVEAGADGLVLFNRFVHTDIDLEQLKEVPDLVCSRSYESRVPMAWISLLRGRIDASLAATSGVHCAEDVIKLLLVGADVTMMASLVYEQGIEKIASVLKDVTRWLEEHEYESVEQIKGSLSQEHSPNPAAFERMNYMKTIVSFNSKQD